MRLFFKKTSTPVSSPLSSPSFPPPSFASSVFDESVSADCTDEQQPHFPLSQTTSHHSAQYQVEDDLHQAQRSHLPRTPPNPSSSYLPYHPQLDRPPSQQSLAPPSPVASDHRQASQARHSNQSSASSHLQAGMARGDGNNMRQAQQHQQAEQSHGQYSGSQNSRQLQQHSSSMADHGRNTPELNLQDYTTLLAKHEELQAKYSKVKKFYFSLESQVTTLQNAIANQRLSMSKTTLDDHEYTTRFNRLDGAINNLSFNIRKDWKGVPPWLAAMVNKDAHTVGTKEMTAVGRACITRWVVDEILDRYLHPQLEPGLSSQLKIIEKNIRRAGHNQAIGEEQREDLIVKLTSWRLTTLEGLADSMATEQGAEYKQQLTANMMEKLTASLQMNLNEPPPPGLESGVGMIIELAIGLACALPLESRDVCVEYYMPGSVINETYMKVESGIPPLTNPGINIDYLGPPEQQQVDQGSTHSGDSNSLNENEDDGDNNGSNTNLPPRGDSLQGSHAGSGANNGQQQQMKKDDNRKKSLFGGLVSAGPVSKTKKTSSAENTSNNPNGGGLAPGSNHRLGSTSSGASAGASTGKDRESMEKSDRDRRIRFAAFVGVDVRGKGKEGANVLVKAPCYSF